jgi:hypothetical protein
MTDIEHRDGPISKRWFILSLIIGAFLMGIALWLESVKVGTPVWDEILVHVGADVFMAGVLLLLSRRLVVRVQQAVARAATAAAEAVLEQNARQVEVRIDELAERIDRAVEARNRRQDDAVSALERPSYESVADALAEANKLGAVQNGVIRVQASRERGELALDFSWGTNLGDERFHQVQLHELLVKAHVYADQARQGGWPVIQTVWEPTDTADAVGFRLREQLERQGRWKGDGTLVWPMVLKNLQRSLDLAIRSRRRDGSGPELQGALIEMVNGEWAITDAGLECPSRKFVLSESAFPDLLVPAFERQEAAKWRPTPRPEWVDADQWSGLVAEGRRRFPIRRGPLLGQPQWVPLSQRPADLRSDTTVPSL